MIKSSLINSTRSSFDKYSNDFSYLSSTDTQMVSKLFDNIDLREKMGKCSSKYVEEHCSYDVVSKEMEITVTNQRKEPIDMLSEKPVISNIK